jgi:hypothetical protein
MNQKQKITLLISFLNLAVIFLFPPFDTFSIANATIPVFSGFHFVFDKTSTETINASMLYLEVAVVLINTGIAWLLLQDKKSSTTRRKINFQNATLIFVAFNLVLILLFPPFENADDVSSAILPSFQGFYFIFDARPEHVLVTTLLYLEVILVLINGAIFWLLFKENKSGELSPEEAQKLLRELREGK